MEQFAEQGVNLVEVDSITLGVTTSVDDVHGRLALLQVNAGSLLYFDDIIVQGGSIFTLD